MSEPKSFNEMSPAEFLREVLKWGCSCDAMNGYSCGHGAIIDEIVRRLDPNAK